jgi:hypothetical protein
MAKSDLINEINSKDIAPDVKEKALAAIERICETGESVFNPNAKTIADYFFFDSTREGWDFWDRINNAVALSPHLPSSPGKEEAVVVAQHTPGKWFVAPQQYRHHLEIISDWNDGLIATIGVEMGDEGEAKANAELLASAPTLLEQNSLLKEQVRVMREALGFVQKYIALRTSRGQTFPSQLTNSINAALNFSEGNEAEAAGGNNQ